MSITINKYFFFLSYVKDIKNVIFSENRALAVKNHLREVSYHLILISGSTKKKPLNSGQKLKDKEYIGPEKPSADCKLPVNLATKLIKE